MIVHKRSAHEVAGRCAALGKTVLAGGPLFTTGHAGFPEIGHFVLGEAEGVIGRLVEDLRRGWRDMVFIVDDNFIGNRKRAKELLRALIEWRCRTDG